MEKMIRVAVVLAAIVIAGLFVVRIFVLHLYRIPTGGMSPTYSVGSHAIANHFDADPERGKAIVFPFPEDRTKDFVQRIIGIGGDKIQVKGGHPFINDWEVPSCRVGKYDRLDDGYVHHADVFVEFLGKNTFLVSIESESDGGVAPEKAVWNVKPGYVFTMGDNRMNSYDSRQWPTQVGVDDQTIWGGFPATDTPTLPPDATALQSALDDCLKKRPAKTAP